uniref:Uncharacterized protein n=1 Tax=Meloidogyne javanica TaxID=6303 RepID=A0A915MBI0_MELJA
MYKVEIPLPKLCRNIANPVLQNGTGQEFTYIFDFMKVQDKGTNINFVQLADFQSHSTGHMAGGFQTPLNLPFNFEHLNLEEGESSQTGGSKARKSFSVVEGRKLNFDNLDDLPESSASRNIPRPRKSNAQRPMERQGASRRLPPRASVDIPSSRQQVENSGNEGLQEGNNSARTKKNLRRNTSMPLNRSNRNDMSNRRSDVEGSVDNKSNHPLYGVGSHSFDGIQGQGNFSGSHDQSSGFGQSNWSGNQDSSNIPPLFPQQWMHGSFPHQFQPESFPHQFQPESFPHQFQPESFPHQFQPGSFPHQPQPGSLPQQLDQSESFTHTGVYGNLPVYNHPHPGQEQQLYGQGYQYPPLFYQYPPHYHALNAQHGSVHNVPQTSNNEAGSSDTDTPNVVYYPDGYVPPPEPQESEPSYSYYQRDGKWYERID